jgi:hypothetical protein
MKITTFNPQIVTKDPEPIIKLFEELGFERRHTKEGIGKLAATAYRMKDTNGLYIDISKASFQLPQDTVVIRMNVDNFDEAYQLLQNHGFKNVLGDDRIAETGSSRNAVMGSPSGFKILLIQHIKD